MNFEGINFPLYRKYKNNKSYFKIIHSRLFEEVQSLGSKRIVKQIEANLYPEMNFIRDLVYNENGMAIDISEEDYLNFKEVS